MARLWRERWLAKSEKDISVVERLQDAERPCAPTTFSLEQILLLFAIRNVECLHKTSRLNIYLAYEWIKAQARIIFSSQ